MAAGPWVFTNTTRIKILSGTWNFVSDSFKTALFLSTSNIGPTSTTYAGLTNEHANANGYTTGGIAVTFATLTGTSSVPLSFATNPVWNAVTGNITARFGVLYEVAGDVVAYHLLDSTPLDVTATPGNSLTIDSDGVPGPVLTLA